MMKTFWLPVGMDPKTFYDLVKVIYGMTSSDYTEPESMAVARKVAEMYVGRIHTSVQAEERLLASRTGERG